MDQKRLKGGRGYVTQFWIFSQLVGNLSCTGCCEDLRKAAISPDRVSSKEIKKKNNNKKKEIFPCQLSWQHRWHHPQHPAAVQNQGEGGKNPFNEDTQVPISADSHISPPYMLNKAAKNLPRHVFLRVSCVHAVLLLRVRGINLNFCTCSHLWGERGFWEGNE